MKASSWRNHRLLRGSMTSAAAVALVAIGVPAAALASHTGSHPQPNIGSGYPPPGGIYAPFTNCPLYNPVIQEAVTFTACVGADATTGSITLGSIVTPVLRAVNVQFGFYAGAGQTYYADVLPPIAGVSAQLSTQPDLIPDSLTTALGCSTATNSVVVNLCTKAENFGGRYLDVYALAQSDGAITNFSLLNWTQPVKFKLINPLLGNHCYIGSLGNPVMLQPQLTLNSAKIEPDPNPTKHPDTEVLATQASATATGFSVPGVTGCGPGGVANIPIDEALDAGSGLPAASGNSLTLTGSFDIAVCSAAGDSSLTQPQNNAKILLSAFADSTKSGGPEAASHVISGAALHKFLKHLGAP
jgi:hypothetical protein